MKFNIAFLLTHYMVDYQDLISLFVWQTIIDKWI